MGEGMEPFDAAAEYVGHLEAAEEQLNWAIRMLVDHQAYLCAITLASAADGLLGKQLGERSAHAKLKNFVEGELGEHASALNLESNWLKHGGDPVVNKKALELNAVAMICRAGINHVQIARAVVSEMPRFNEWLDRHPDLVPVSDA